MARTSSFGQALQQRRKALDLTQQELAQQVGCAVVTIQRIEQETLRPSRQIVQHLAAILDIPADEREQFVRLARSVPLPDTSEAQLGAPTRAPSTRSLLPMPLTPLITYLDTSFYRCALAADGVSFPHSMSALADG